MITFIYGTLKDIKQHYEIGEYISDIKAYLNESIGLFNVTKPDTVYFIYNAKDLKDKTDIDAFIQKAHRHKSQIYCIIETIDKKTSFYKAIKSNMIDMSKNTLDTKGKALKFYKDIIIIKTIEDNEIVTFLYTLYFNFSNQKYKKIAGKLINMVLTGKINSKIAKKLLLYYATKN